MANLDPSVLTTIAHSYVDVLSGAFVHLSQVAQQLFYVVAGIELALFGLIWALRQHDMLGHFLMKIFKLGIIFFIITSFPYLLQVIIDGFTKVAFSIVPRGTSKVIFNPAEIWRYGFDASISLLNLAVEYGTSNMGITLIYTILGFGTLTLFALIGAQIILVIVTFYVVSLIALLLIPLGTFSLAKNLFEKAIQSVFSAGARVFALILVLGVLMSLWAQYSIGAFSQSTTLDVPLGFFVLALVSCILTIKLPNIAAQTVGKIGGQFLLDTSSSSTTVNVTQVSSNMSTGVSSAVLSGSSAMSGATNLSNVAAGAQVVGGVGSPSPMQSAASISTAASVVSAGGSSKVGEGANLNRGISRETLNKLKSSFRQVLNENANK